MEQDGNERYKEKAALRQASCVWKKASATQKQGLLIVHTGRGKGKTTAALGLAFRVQHPYKAGIKAQRGVEFYNDTDEAAWRLRKPGL